MIKVKQVIVHCYSNNKIAKEAFYQHLKHLKDRYGFGPYLVNNRTLSYSIGEENHYFICNDQVFAGWCNGRRITAIEGIPSPAAKDILQSYLNH